MENGLEKVYFESLLLAIYYLFMYYKELAIYSYTYLKIFSLKHLNARTVADLTYTLQFSLTSLSK